MAYKYFLKQLQLILHVGKHFQLCFSVKVMFLIISVLNQFLEILLKMFVNNCTIDQVCPTDMSVPVSEFSAKALKGYLQISVTTHTTSVGGELILSG